MHHTSIYVEIRDIIDESDCDHGDSLNIMLFLFPIFSKFFFQKKDIYLTPPNIVRFSKS